MRRRRMLALLGAASISPGAYAPPAGAEAHGSATSRFVARQAAKQRARKESQENKDGKPAD